MKKTRMSGQAERGPPNLINATLAWSPNLQSAIDALHNGALFDL
jgi:hypothetical protein